MGITHILAIIALSLCLAQGAIVTPFTNCTNCQVVGAYFPSITSILLETIDNTAWLSVDEGQHWQNVAQNVIDITSSPNNSNYMVFTTGKSRSVPQVKVITTIDGAKTLNTIGTLPSGLKAVHGITMHPFNPSWILAYYCTDNACITFYSTNFGSTWAQGPSNIIPATVIWSTDPLTPDVIFAIRAGTRAFSYTTDYGSTWHDLFSTTLGYVLTDNFLYVGIVKPGTNSALLYASSSLADPTHLQRENYVEAEFPNSNDLPESGYTFLDDSARSEYIAVAVQSAKNWGSLYQSDFDGDQFVLTKDFIYQSGFTYDFAKINGLEGIFVLNAHPSATSAAVKTYFTYDNGGDWNLVNPPQTDYFGNPTNCNLASGCSLHLSGPTAWASTNPLPPFYTSDNAIGLIIGLGNTGTALDTRFNNPSTYFSRDAGITWVELYNKPTIYEFGDHGGILVFAVINKLTTSLMYSLNEGLTINTYNFTTTPMYVENIITEPSGTGQKFVLMGYLSPSKRYIFGIDFSDLNLPICGEDDYEEWSPKNEDNANTDCFLGEQRFYTRRKQTSSCFNDRGADHLSRKVQCVCAWEDYECDVGFTASERNSTDGFTCTSYTDVDPPKCATGYRKIPDTECVGGLNLNSVNCAGYSGSPTTDGTSTGSGKGSHTGTAVAIVLVIVILCGGIGAAAFMYNKNENFREWTLARVDQIKQIVSPRGGAGNYGRVSTEDHDEEVGGSAILN